MHALVSALLALGEPQRARPIVVRAEDAMLASCAFAAASSLGDVRRAIDAIETTTPSGVRDPAMLLLLATTGLRSRELRQVELGDIRWRTGELLLRHTKGHRDRVVPLLDETGAALAKYVLHARPLTSERRVFLSHVTPVRAFSHSGTVSRIIRIRLQRAGIPIQRGGAHLLRHSLATRLVEQRRPIKEVADLLGHRSIDTTSLYVKVAVPQLADVALPFPGGARCVSGGLIPG